MHHRPSFLALVAILFAVAQSATSYPIITSRWDKADLLEDTKAHRSWKSWGEEGLDLLPELPRAKIHPVSCNVNIFYTALLHLRIY
jgi:hypothetical protein